MSSHHLFKYLLWPKFPNSNFPLIHPSHIDLAISRVSGCVLKDLQWIPRSHAERSRSAPPYSTCLAPSSPPKVLCLLYTTGLHEQLNQDGHRKSISNICIIFQMANILCIEVCICAKLLRQNIKKIVSK